jgi:2'-5' RNA ligase
MKEYRDILLFPKFDNVDILEKIRKECDELYGIIQPHITIVFPFIDDISDEDLIKNIEKYFESKTKFYVKFSGISYSEDDYIFLNCVEGENEIINLHDELYNKFFYNHLSDRQYIPHITIGQKYNSNEEQLRKIENMNDKFECYIDTVVVEKIGANEESIILKRIKLK